jgi:hypothetical protein
MSIPTISALVGHSGGGNATSRYIHKLDATLVTAANRVAESIATMMDRPQDDDRIVTMPIRQVGGREMHQERMLDVSPKI